MDRKHCVLLYSKYSQASLDLLSYIKGLPLDFPKVTGMTMICIDNDVFKNTLIKNGVEYVPTLLVEYYKGATPNMTKQKFEREYIYMWIDQVMTAIHIEQPQSDQQSQSHQQSHQQSEPPQGKTMLPNSDEPQIQKKDKVDITSLAQQMAKDRDSYISETTPAQKRPV